MKFVRGGLSLALVTVAIAGFLFLYEAARAQGLVSTFHPRGQGAVNSVLVAVPEEGHSGDQIFLAGSGFPPNESEFITMACPDWANNPYSNIASIPGPHTDGKGNFTAFKMAAITLQHFQTSGCKIYASVGSNPYGVDIPAPYTILPPGVAPSSCQSRICAAIHLRPRRVRPGLQETIRVQTKPLRWPGAHVDVALQLPGAQPLIFHRSLDWRGATSVTVKIGGRVPHPVSASVRINLHLGGYSGRNKAILTVLD